MIRALDFIVTLVIGLPLIFILCIYYRYVHKKCKSIEAEHTQMIKFMQKETMNSIERLDSSLLDESVEELDI